MAIGDAKNYPPGPGGATAQMQAADMNKIALIRAATKKKSNMGSAAGNEPGVLKNNQGSMKYGA